MKNRIACVFGDEKLEHWDNITYPHIHVIDLTQRTKNIQGVQIFDIKPQEIDTLLIENPNLDITATFFKPQCFLNENKKEPDNCEGVFYLTNSTKETWVLFIEIKDCKAKNISKHFNDAKEQVQSVVQIFRDKEIIERNKLVYANISFPRRKKTDFYNQLIKSPEQTKFRKEYKILIKGTNHLKIKNSTTIY